MCPARRTRRSAGRSPPSTPRRGPRPRGDGSPPGPRASRAPGDGSSGSSSLLTGSAGARVRPADIALRHEPPHPDRVPGRQQVVGALGPQAVGRREIAIEMTHVERSDRGQLMDDHLRPRPRHGLRDLIGIKRVRDHRHGAELGRASPALTRSASCHEPRDPPATSRGTNCFPIAPVAPATNTLIISSLIEDYLHHKTRQQPRL